MTESIETIIIGGGQAGLSLSYWLKQAGHEHIVLEQAAQPGSAWLKRWNSFTFVTPNWAIRLPGGEYTGNAPDAFLPRAEILMLFADYAQRRALPVRYGVKVTCVKPAEAGYVVETESATWIARNVIIATGSFQKPKLPAYHTNLPSQLLQLHSGDYRRPDDLPAGAVLVIGSGQSGSQITEELYQSGRKVYLSVGGAGRVPRRYRGRDAFWWLNQTGFLDRTVAQLPTPQARFAANPQISGAGGGHSLNLHQFVRDGVTLLDRVLGTADGRLTAAPNLSEALSKVDQFEANIVKMIDGYIEKTGMDAPAEELPQLRDGYNAEVVAELDLKANNITTIIWGMGYAFDFGWVRLPIFDDMGSPVQERGVTTAPGLYFLGLNWMHKMKSALLLGVGEDAAYLADHITARVG